MHPYQYKPLPNRSSIRILILQPAADTSSALQCEIITHDRLTILQGLHNKTFDAVSYVWGNGTHDIPLYCQSEGTYLYIPAVVDEMLRSLRKGHKERRLWVDALCLNQKDNQEKSIQVQQMGQIYHMADKVHIWLGPAVTTTPLAFAFLRTLVARFKPLPGQARDPTTAEILDTFGEIFQHHNFQPVLDLLQRSWFTRRWTLQEGFLARDAIVRCGGSKLAWHWFTEGLEFIQKTSQGLQGIQRDNSALYSLNVLRTLQEPADLLSLLWTFHMSECSDPRDKIYSLLGLAQDMNQKTPQTSSASSKGQPHSTFNHELPFPDYALSPGAVYRGFVSHCISTNRFLQILLHIDAFGRLSEVNPEWPSWVPNWTRARDSKLNLPTATSYVTPRIRYIDKTLFFTQYQTPNETYHNEFLFPQPTEYASGYHQGLVIYGKSIQKTIRICDPWPESNNTHQLVEYLFDWIHEEVISHLPNSKLHGTSMVSQVTDRLLCLTTGSEFLGYAKHNFLHNSRDRRIFGAPIDRLANISKCQRIANSLYPIAISPEPYTLEQVYLKEHLDKAYNDNPSPTVKDRQEMLGLLNNVSRMMREGKKQLIAASCDDDWTPLTRRHWIAPSEVRLGDVITHLSHCRRIGALLRPIDSPSQLEGRPTFQLIGILWSLGDIYDSQIPGRREKLKQPEEFLIL